MLRMGQAASISSAVGRKSQLTSLHSEGFFLRLWTLSFTCCLLSAVASEPSDPGAQSSMLLPVECSYRSSVLLPVECSYLWSAPTKAQCSYLWSAPTYGVLLPKLSAPTCGVLLPKLSAPTCGVLLPAPAPGLKSMLPVSLSRACGSYLIYSHRLCSTVRLPLQPSPSCQIPSLEVLSPWVPFPSQ